MTFQERYQYNPKTDLLGKGGFAKVYRATDTLLDRVVALKFYNVSDSDKHTLTDEIRKAIGLDHPNLCRYYDVIILENQDIHGETEVTEVGVMEFLNGGDIKNFIQEYPHFRDKLLTDVLQGISYLHRKGIIHRDLKAQNILVKHTDDGPLARITDFGISKFADHGQSKSSALVGTIDYMAPEQFNAAKYGVKGKISTTVDLWSFGVMIYDILTNESLFGDKKRNIGPEQIMNNILTDYNTDEKINRLPEPYRLIVAKCLVKNAADRVQTAQEFISILEGHGQSPPETRVIDPSMPPETVVFKHNPVKEEVPKYEPIQAKAAVVGAKKPSSLTQKILLWIFLIALAGGGAIYGVEFYKKSSTGPLVMQIKTEPAVLPEKLASGSSKQFLENFPGPTGFVNDYALVLDEQENNLLEKKLAAYSDKTTKQIAIVTLDSLPLSVSADEFATSLGNQWGVGNAWKNNGLLILFIKSSKMIRITTGKGTQMVVTNQICQQIIQNQIIPNFKKADFYTGFDEGVTQIMKIWGENK